MNCPYCGMPESDTAGNGWSFYGCGTMISSWSQKRSDHCEARTELIAAYRIINVLTMMDIDRKEPWPDALQWLERNGEFKPQNTNQTEL